MNEIGYPQLDGRDGLTSVSFLGLPATGSRSREHVGARLWCWLGVAASPYVSQLIEA